MIQRFSRQDSVIVVIIEHLAQQIQCTLRHQMPIPLVNKLFPVLFRVIFLLSLFGRSTQRQLVLVGQLDVLLLQLLIEVFGSQHFHNLLELVKVVFTLQKRLLVEKHSGKHTP